MDAALGFHVAVGIGSFEAERRQADARAFAFGDVFDLDLEAAAVGPARVHPEKHIGPIVGFRPAGAGLDGHDGIGFVVRTREEGRDLDVGDLGE